MSENSKGRVGMVTKRADTCPKMKKKDWGGHKKGGYVPENEKEGLEWSRKGRLRARK